MRLPEALRSRDAELRERIGARVGRGRVELSVEFAGGPVAAAGVPLDLDAARAWAGALRPLVEEGIVAGPLRAADLLRLPGVLGSAPPETAWGEEEAGLLDRLLAAALDQMIGARTFEGERICAVLDRGLAELAGHVGRLEARRSAVAGGLAAMLRTRIAELVGEASLPEERIAQEAALLADRSDVREEIDRLRAHAEQFAALSREAGPVGRRLDFLVQEIFRELNTLGAKARDAEMARHVVEAKAVCEQLREQIQNVE
jgi:uncharacterized protein (TIGR00255 family)